MRLTQSEQQLQINFEGEDLTIQKISQTHQEIQMVLLSSTPIYIDLSDLRRVDSTGLQFLLFMSRQLSSKGIEISWSSLNSNLAELCSIYGIDLKHLKEIFVSESKMESES